MMGVTTFPHQETLFYFIAACLLLSRCAIRGYRHYKKLAPRLANPRQRLDEFKEHFWKLYRQLLAYRQHPTPKEADDLRGEFERLFGQSSDYEQLDQRKALTLAKHEHLLMVLSHPEILLHNNPAEQSRPGGAYANVT
jgi:hypothetical protein